jgi:beta-lactamase regulating signal transducer with metallopeptidase domain
MSSIHQFCLIAIGQVTAITCVATLLIVLFRKSATGRHSAGLLALVLILSSPLLAGCLPAANWWGLPATAPVPASASVIVDSGHVLGQSSSNLLATGRHAPGAKEQITPSPAELISSPVISSAVGSQSSSSEFKPGESSGTVVSSSLVLSLVLNLFLFVWIAGASVCLSRWMWKRWQLRWLMRSLSINSATNSRACEAVSGDVCGVVNLRHLPPIVVSSLVPMAMVVGLWRPKIILPSELIQLDATTRLRDVLIHECAHIARRDVWVNAAQQLAAILWWWHPGVLCLNRWLAQSREEICDNFVLQYGNVAEYAMTLLELTELCSTRCGFVPALGLLGSRWTLEERITGLLQPERDTRTTSGRRTIIFTSALLATMCVLVGGVRAVEDRPQTQLDMPQQAVANGVEPPKSQAAPVIDASKGKPDIRTVTGNVIDENDQPIAGARVWWDIGYAFPDEVLAETVSDAQGRFTLSTPDVSRIKREAFHDGLWALKAGKQMATVPARIFHLGNGKRSDPVIRLRNMTDTSFIVKSPDHRPVVGATVEPWHFRSHRGYAIIPEPIRRILTQISDADGRVSMPDLPRQGFSTVRTSIGDFGVQELRLDCEGAEPAERVLELRPACRLEGQFTASNPAWVRGIRLSIETEGNSEQSWKSNGVATAMTDEQGRFVVLAIAEGKVHVRVDGTGDMRALPRVPENFEITAGETKQLKIPLESPVIVRGAIKTADTDQPVAGADILVGYGTSIVQRHRIVSDANGQYKARVLPGLVHIQVTSCPAAPPDYDLPSNIWGTKDFVQESDNNLPLVLPASLLVPTVVLKGKLIDQAGRPVIDTRIRSYKAGRPYGGSATDENGDFSVRVPKDTQMVDYQVHFGVNAFPIKAKVEQGKTLILRIDVPPK